jgi:hypothetical protein
MAMDIQPSSARTRGRARRRVGRNWPRKWKRAREASSAGRATGDGIRTDMIEAVARKNTNNIQERGTGRSGSQEATRKSLKALVVDCPAEGNATGRREF